MPITWKGAHSGNFGAGRAGHRPEAIVIHIMDGTLAGTDAWFNDPVSSVSAHYGIGQNGAIHQYVKEADTAFHAGIVDRPDWSLIKPGVNPNRYTIGIEHEGRDNSPYPWSPAQMTASIGLVREIAGRWGIPLDEDHVITHHMIRRSKTCPGSNFDHADYVQRLGGLVAGPAAAAWNGGVLRAAGVVNIRPRPGTTEAPIGRLLAQEVFPATQLVAEGEPVRGNSRWFGDGAGRFVWAGATDRPNG
jgi:N-acetylmuramoyl-L-alanine amidase